MHLLCELCGGGVEECLPQLCGRICAASDPPEDGTQAGGEREGSAALKGSGAFLAQPRGDRDLQHGPEGHRAGRQVT